MHKGLRMDLDLMVCPRVLTPVFSEGNGVLEGCAVRSGSCRVGERRHLCPPTT